MAKTISFGVQKGGSSKTTTTGIFTYLLARSGHRVLAVDMDCQGNLTEMLTNVAANEFHERTVLEAIQEREAEKYIHRVNELIDVLPANNLLTLLPRYLYQRYGFSDPYIYKILGEILEPLKSRYDWIVIDTPPALSEATMNSLVASDYVVVMFESSQWCYSAIPNFLESVQLAISLNPDLQVAGLLRTLNDVRRSDAKAFNDLIAQDFPDLVFDTIIRRKATTGRLAINGFSDENKEVTDAIDQYEEFYKELMNRVGEAELAR
ncbi:ParA family protein (plasmid) [Alicyclobacillus fastidiosus]|uniref:ParA family protein n=1 Tax=Alicyclobacillus fastidiosus TaxID=392011 RepID=A0ABY6ZPA1_9BACL|nr:ParA family protein [Alicyclobacillus fastidiosus]WAH44813.1 ParA family protein [Alicyclobacillus fastidiosus]GMA65774.1 sporulation initiation inhibitor Soj [Alicyclobacillus fastidiosus]